MVLERRYLIPPPLGFGVPEISCRLEEDVRVISAANRDLATAIQQLKEENANLRRRLEKLEAVVEAAQKVMQSGCCLPCESIHELVSALDALEEA